MPNKSIIVIGNPDSGKTNFIARLWLALQSKKFPLRTGKPPDDIAYVESIAEHLLRAKFAPRTEKEDVKREFDVSVKDEHSGAEASILIPDINGEIWKKAVETLEIPTNWMSMLTGATSALIFVRALSELNVQPLDWVTSKQLLEAGLGGDKADQEIPTQISMIELLRFLEDSLVVAKRSTRVRIAVIVSAWDLLDQDQSEQGPEQYLENQFPLFAGRIKDIEKMDIQVFGSSVVGGDFTIEEFTKAYQENDYDDSGYIISKAQDGTWKKINDITIPISWLLGISQV